MPMKSVSQANVIKFVKHELILRFGLPETLTCDNGSVFSEGEVSQFAQEYGIMVTFSTPYYAQGNGQRIGKAKICFGDLVGPGTDEKTTDPGQQKSNVLLLGHRATLFPAVSQIGGVAGIPCEIQIPTNPGAIRATIDLFTRRLQAE
ncbi:uncharacterized protein LOC122650661 [Telopea speciosissima]|uniref:uncharacterized protein LOC122650661 n=1 Tax=Telopea speciosissima TaxID=54955 RepID=UPI001CC38CBA|nr:uncharacterized protein LOC122650661 [Telopea speciosissima]